MMRLCKTSVSQKHGMPSLLTKQSVSDADQPLTKGTLEPVCQISASPVPALARLRMQHNFIVELSHTHAGCLKP